MPFNFPFKLEQIAPIVAGIIAAIGLIAGITGAATGEGSSGQTSSERVEEQLNFPKEARDLRAAMTRYAKSLGYNVVYTEEEARKKAPAGATPSGSGGSYATSGLPQLTKSLNEEAARFEKTPSEYKGVALIEIEYGPVITDTMITYYR